MITIACVLRSGGEFRVEHVHALAVGVSEHLTMPHRFVCLTDMGEGSGGLIHPFGARWTEVIGPDIDTSHGLCETIPLLHNWPGWWSKLELFRPWLFDGPVVYFDLDTVIVAPLDGLVLGHRFTVLENFWSPDRIGSGLMAWDADLSEIYRRFLVAPEVFMRQYTTVELWGDQGFIRFNCPVPMERWQHKHPGKVVSYRRHVLPAGRVPEGAAVVCYGGKSRPWNTPPVGRDDH